MERWEVSDYETFQKEKWVLRYSISLRHNLIQVHCNEEVNDGLDVHDFNQSENFLWMRVPPHDAALEGTVISENVKDTGKWEHWQGPQVLKHLVILINNVISNAKC